MPASRFEDFMQRTEKDLDKINQKLDKLWDFRILMIGGSIVISTLSSIVACLAYLYLGIK